MTVNERIAFLKNFYKKKGIEFYRYINIPSSTVNSVVAGRMSAPSHLLLEAILKSFPEVNIYWLILGEGEPFIKSKGEKKLPLIKSDLAQARIFSEAVIKARAELEKYKSNLKEEIKEEIIEELKKNKTNS